MTAAGVPLLRAQERPAPIFRVKVDMVVLSFTGDRQQGPLRQRPEAHGFPDLRGRHPAKDRDLRGGRQGARWRCSEDGTHQAAARRPARTRCPAWSAPDAFVGTNVFVLFDTSNFMYRGFVYAEDAIADFVRGLDRADSVAVYTFSRNLSRAAPLTRDHSDAIAGLRKAVAGDDTALYNALLLTLRDAAKVPGRKVVIVFSNGPDNASMVAPDDVRAVAEDEGIPIYVISTTEVNKDPISSERLQAHLAAHRRQGLLGQDLAEAGGGLRGHPRGPGQLLHGHLLSAAESQRGLPQDHHRAGRTIPARSGASRAGRGIDRVGCCKGPISAGLGLFSGGFGAVVAADLLMAKAVMGLFGNFVLLVG